MPIDIGDENESLYCPQQVLVRNLTDVFLRDGGDLRFEAADVTPENLTGPRPLVRYQDGTGRARAIGCDNDAEVLARAVIRQVRRGDASLLDAYSDTCLSHAWNYRAFAAWITELMHNAGDASREGEFRKQTARAELRRQFTSPAANRLFGELVSGVN
ncbi:Rossmann-fold NAD(P)-binding domain-containing protein [Streptomyces corynorhini]|uniref:hypothetical protein n=1 Tax=Streptomyces corynorhini TaxID=2282652 RepID=UPI0026A40ABE|nr:hypothetical protein [Streptomyces corynorhini]